jgi:N-acylneuraminate cytidylyltransferase
MSAIAIIPARGGSKRIPRKNIRPFCGNPLILGFIQAGR